jgi:hypothetical protein
VAYYFLIADTNSLGLRRSNSKSNTNPRILEYFIFCVEDRSSSGYTYKDQISKSDIQYTVIHIYR